MNNHSHLELLCTTTQICVGQEAKIAARSGLRRNVDCDTAIKVLQQGGKITHRSWVVQPHEYVSLVGETQLIDETGKLEKEYLFEFFRSGWSDDAKFIAFDEPITIHFMMPKPIF